MIRPDTPLAARIDSLRNAVVGTLRRCHAGNGDIAGCYFVPGRIEVLGKHTDYAGGRSLVAAVDRGFVIASARRADNVVRVIDSVTGEQVVINTDAAGDAGTDDGLSIPAWATYPLTVVRRCTANFPSAKGGADIAFASDLPQAAGLSSSSALVVAVFLAVDAVRGISATPEYTAAIRDNADLAGYLGAVENGMSYRTLEGGSGVGTMGGSEDHTAILCARAGSLMQFSYAPVRYENDVRMPAGWTFAVGATGVRAEKAGTDLQHYNNLAAAVRQLVRCWHDTEAGDEDTLAGVLGSSPDAALRLREIVRQRAGGEADGLMARLAQFIAESEEIVPAARAALARGDVTAFSTLARRSQHYAEHVLGNQVPETIQLVASAHELGAAAASAFGAGFGGSVWALVREDEAEVFLNAWKVDYHARFAHRQAESAFFITPAAAPATRLEEVIA